MAREHIDFGTRGEDAAVRFLEQSGLRILARNYRWSRAEVDIVAQSDAALHFVEVKARHARDVAAGADAVGWRKQRNVMAAAGRYMDDADYDGDFQFDIVVVLVDGANATQVVWRQDAFGFFN